MKIPFRKSGGGITVEIRVEPRSSRASIEEVKGDVVKVRLTSPPAGGAANRQLIELLAKEWDLRKSSIRIIRGEKSKNKVVRIEGIDSL